MRKTILALLFLSYCCFSALGQTVYTLADTIVGNQWLKETKELLNRRQYDSAFAKADSARVLFEQILGKESQEVADVYLISSKALTSMEYFSKAEDLLNKALAIKIKKFGDEHSVIASVYEYFVVHYSHKRENDKALFFCYKALNIYLQQFGKEDPQVASIYIRLGILYSQTYDLDKTIACYFNALMANNDKNRNLQSNILGRIASVYCQKGNYSKSLELAQKALALNPKSIAVYGLIRQIYVYQREYEKAIEYWQKAIDITEEASKNEESLFYLLAQQYSLLGETYEAKGDYEKAIEYEQKAFVRLQMMRLDNLKEDAIAGSYYNLGTYYEAKRLFDTAQIYFLKTIDLILQKRIDGRFRTRETFLISTTFKSLAKLSTKKNCIVAKTYFEKALKTLGFEDEQNLYKVIFIDVLIDNLEAKAAFERNWYLENGDKVHLYESVQTYQQAFTALNYQNQSFSADGSKVAQKSRHYNLYEGAIQTNLLLKTLQSQQNAFTYNEQIKACLLQSQLKETNALRYANITDFLLEREKDLRLTITAIEKGRQERLSEGKSETDSLNLVLSSRADSLRTLYADLKKTFEQNYPDYYRLKYNNKTIDVTEVQQKLLSKEQTLLSYFVGDSSIYAFVVRPDTFAVFDFKKDFPLESWIKQLRDGLYGYHTASMKTEKLYEMKADSFTIAAYELHQKLIAPLSNLLTKEVIIVPDGVLGYVPFDVLLTEKPKEVTQFNKHNYFGNNHIISYNYSATLWQEMRDKKHKTEPKKPFIGFAPFFNGDTTLLSNLFSHDIAMRKGLDSLRNSGEEVFKAQKLMHGESMMDKKATKETFEKVAGDYRIVHLATHGKANDKIGDYCFLAFTEQKDSLQNELLYVRDIYNLSLNADLVVLSACETGIGELKRGEGIVSLSRAFAYAGAKSMVTTLWSVNDKSTMYIMEGFYRQLKEGKTKDYALWKAKQDYLKKAKDEMAHPFFWSAFIPIGDMSVIKK